MLDGRAGGAAGDLLLEDRLFPRLYMIKSELEYCTNSLVRRALRNAYPIEDRKLLAIPGGNYSPKL